MNPLGEFAELLDGRRELLDRQRERVRRFGEPSLRGAELHQQRDQTLLRAIVKVSFEPLSRIVGGRQDAGARLPHLCLVPLAVGDIGAADQEDGAALDPGQGRTRPCDLELGSVPLHPLPLVLGRCLAPDRRLDAITRGGPFAVWHVPVPEQHAACLVRLVPERALEGLIRRVGTHAPVVVDQADQTGRVVRDCVQELAFALELVDPLP
jgi:hypothetical protein